MGSEEPGLTVRPVNKLERRIASLPFRLHVRAHFCLSFILGGAIGSVIVRALIHTVRRCSRKLCNVGVCRSGFLFRTLELVLSPAVECETKE